MSPVKWKIVFNFKYENMSREQFVNQFGSYDVGILALVWWYIKKWLTSLSIPSANHSPSHPSVRIVQYCVSEKKYERKRNVKCFWIFTTQKSFYIPTCCNIIASNIFEYVVNHSRKRWISIGMNFFFLMYKVIISDWLN